MHLKAFRKWVRRVYSTRDEELDCDGLFKAIPHYVDMEVEGKDPEVHFPDVKHHLSQCAECYDLYLTLRDVAQLEARHVASEPAELERL